MISSAIQHRFMYIIMILRFKTILFLIHLTLCTSYVVGQVNDAGLWTSVSVEKKLSSRITAGLSQEFRFNENISELGTFFTELGAEYKINKYLDISAGYRFINKRRLDDSYSKRHRYLVNVTARRKFNNLSVAFRTRFQSQYSDVYSSDEGSIPDNYVRTKLTLKYDLNRKYNPVISGESFFHVNRPDGLLMDGYRLSAGIEYDFSKKSSVEIAYLLDREIQVNKPWTNYIIALSWSYKL